MNRSSAREALGNGISGPCDVVRPFKRGIALTPLSSDWLLCRRAPQAAEHAPISRPIVHQGTDLAGAALPLSSIRAGGRPQDRRPRTPAHDLPELDRSQAGPRLWRLPFLARAARSARRQCGHARQAPRNAATRPTGAGEQRSSAEQQPREARTSVLRLLPADSVTRHTIDTRRQDRLYRDRRDASRYSINPASDRLRSTTPPMSPTAGDRRTVPSPSASTAGRARRRPFSISVWSGRGLPNSRAPTRPQAGCETIPTAWLAFTDLVMIDPVGTGWSRPAKPDGGSAFYGVRERRQVTRQGHHALSRQERPRRTRRNTFSARATAGSAPPRWRRCCSASKASPSRAS